MSNDFDAFSDFDSMGAAQSVSNDSEVGVLSIPRGKTLWKPKEPGTYVFRIIPYITSKKPGVAPGRPHFVSSYFVHRGVGPNGKGTCIDLSRTYGQRDFISEEIDRMFASNTDPQAKKKKSQHVTALNMLVIDGAGEKVNGKIVVLEMPFSNFYEGLTMAINAKVNSNIAAVAAKNAYLKHFAHPKTGAILYVTFKEETFGGHKFLKLSDVEFEQGPELTAEQLGQALDLDTLIRAKSYDEQKSFMGYSMPTNQEVPAANMAVPEIESKVAGLVESALKRGDTRYYGDKKVEVRKVEADTVNVEDEEGNPYKLNVAQLTETPVKASKPETKKEEKKEAPVSDAPWDQGWDDNK